MNLLRTYLEMPILHFVCTKWRHRIQRYRHQAILFLVTRINYTYYYGIVHYINILYTKCRDTGYNGAAINILVYSYQYCRSMYDHAEETCWYFRRKSFFGKQD